MRVSPICQSRTLNTEQNWPQECIGPLRRGHVHADATTVQPPRTLPAQPFGLDVPLGDPLQTCLNSLTLAQGRARGTSLGCSTLASLRQGSGFFFQHRFRWPDSIFRKSSGTGPVQEYLTYIIHRESELDEDRTKVGNANRPGWRLQHGQRVLA